MHPRSQNTREAVTDKEHLPRVAKPLARERAPKCASLQGGFKREGDIGLLQGFVCEKIRSETNGIWDREALWVR